MDSLALQVENLDTARGGRAEPVPVRAEHERVDHVTCLKRVQVLPIVEIPEHRDPVFTTRGCERAIRRDGDRVDVPGVAVVVCPQLAFGQLPDLADVC